MGTLLVMMGFRTCCSNIRHLGTLKILSWRNLRNRQKLDPWDPPPLLFFPETLHKTPIGRYPPCTKRKGDTLITRNRDSGKSIQTNLVKLTTILLVTSSLFITPRPNLFLSLILHKCTVSLFKMYKSFLLWSLLQVFFSCEGSHVRVKIQ